MTTKFIDQDIRADEGFRPRAYPDPLTGKEPWTVGFGCTGSDIGPTTVWTLAQAVSEQVKRRQQCETALDRATPWWRELTDFRQDVLVNASYQLGVNGLLAFHEMLKAAQAGDFAEAAAQMLSSHWAEQTPSRAKRLARQMMTGERVGQNPTGTNFGVTATQQALNG